MSRCAVRLPIAAVLACAAVFAAANPPQLAPAKAREVEDAVKAEAARLRIPGLSVAIEEDLQLAWSRGFGMADLENEVSATPQTLYRIASISKPITAVAVMQLVEGGKLDLDAPIGRYVPGFAEKQWPVTARQLLSHLSGIRHYRSPDEVYSTRHYASVTEALAIFSSEPLLAEPGSEFHYSTYGYVLLGAAVEGVSGMSFPEYLQRNVFAPAKMSSTAADDVFTLLPHRARGYRRNPAGAIENCGLFDASNKVPGGGLVSTAEDLIRFAIAFQKGQLVNAATRASMLTPGCTTGGRMLPYGLGWNLFERGGTQWVAHSGGQPGASSHLLMNPDSGLAVALLANMEDVDLAPLAAHIADLVAAPEDSAARHGAGVRMQK